MNINKLKEFRLRTYIFLYRLLPIKKNKIVMWADSFKHYGCSPKHLTEHFLNERPGKFDIVWIFDNAVNVPDDLPANVRTVRYFSLKYLKEIHTAGFLVGNTRTSDAFMWKKRRGQKYIQTWHSSTRLKKIEMDASPNLPETYIENAKKDSAKIDAIVSGCDFSSDIFSNSFWYEGDVLKTGTPRCDIFFGDNSHLKAKVCRRLGINPESKIVLYAPTFRNDNRASLNSLDLGSLRTVLKDKYGVDWAVAYRFHPNIKDKYNIKAQAAIDATNYPDMQELLVAADILITDYSSCMFDMAIAHKPCILFAPDFTNYTRNERGLYFDVAKLPFPIATDNNSLAETVKYFDSQNYLNQVDEFLKQVGSYEDGKASARITHYIETNL